MHNTFLDLFHINNYVQNRFCVMQDRVQSHRKWWFNKTCMLIDTCPHRSTSVLLSQIHNVMNGLQHCQDQSSQNEMVSACLVDSYWSLIRQMFSINSWQIHQCMATSAESSVMFQHKNTNSFISSGNYRQTIFLINIIDKQ